VMPDESGYDLLRWLRATLGENRTAVAIALTGLGGNWDRNDALGAGFDENCTKPCELSDLFAVIVRLCGHCGASA
jgi:DNA-binding response OmpR family regulator